MQCILFSYYIWMPHIYYIITDETPKKKGRTETTTPIQPINGASAQVTASLTKSKYEDAAGAGKDAAGAAKDAAEDAEAEDAAEEDAEAVEALEDAAEVVAEVAEAVEEVDNHAEVVDPTPNAFVQEVCDKIAGCSIEGSINTLKCNLLTVLDRSISNDQANRLQENDWTVFVDEAKGLVNGTMAKAGLRNVVRAFQRSKVQALA